MFASSGNSSAAATPHKSNPSDRAVSAIHAVSAADFFMPAILYLLK